MKIKIQSDDKLAASILDRIMDKYEEEERPEDGKWHVSELIFPRQTVARRLKIKGYQTTREDIGFFFLGKAVHREVQRVLGEKHSEVKAEKWGIVATMDYLKRGKDSLALEIKSSRKWTLAEYPAGHYIKQAGYYAVLNDLDQITILVIYPTSGRTWKGKKSSVVEARAWTFFTPPDIRKAIEYDMKRTVEELELAIKKKKVDNLPPAPDWVLNRYDSKIKAGLYDEDEDTEHPFFYAWAERRQL